MYKTTVCYVERESEIVLRARALGCSTHCRQTPSLCCVAPHLRCLQDACLRYCPSAAKVLGQHVSCHHFKQLLGLTLFFEQFDTFARF